MPALPRPAIRRPLSFTIVAVLAVLGLVSSLVVVPVLLVLDLITRTPTRHTRVWCLVVGTLAMELLGVIASVAFTVRSLGHLDEPAAQARFHRLERWWARGHIANLRRFAGVRWVVENPAELDRGHAIVLSRHASHVDAILPVLLFGCMGGHHLRYTLKDDLQWAPAMDIVGNRLPNVFVDRSPGPDSPISARLEALSTDLDTDVAVIFPEGTFFTPERLDRAATRIAETRPELESRVRTLEHLLPPRPAGTLALLRGAPDADLILVAHEGMDAFSDLSTIRHNLPLTEPVRVRLWRIDRSSVPVDDDAFVTWLLDRWLELDRWISVCTAERADLERQGRGGIPVSSLVTAEEYRA